jgi:uncharacterized membrane protein YbhN (UPF0104 family)
MEHPPGMLLLIGLTVIASWIAASLQSVVMLRSQGIRIGLGENFLLILSTTLLNYIPMRIGTVIRMRYMRAVYDLAYSRSLGLFLLRVILVIWASTFLAIIGLAALWLSGVNFGAKTALILLAGLGLGVVLVFLPMPEPREEAGRLRRFWEGFATAIVLVRQRPDLIIALLLLLLAQLAIIAFRMHLAFVVTGNPVGWPILLIVTPIVSLMTLFSFATLGVREALVGGLIATTGSDFSVGVLAASIERGVLILLSFTLGSVATALVLSRIRAAEQRNALAR